MKILIVKVSSLGDVVHNMPVVQDILRAHPDAQVDWLVEEGFADLVGMVKGVHRAIPVALRRWRKTPFAAQTRAEWRAFRARLAQDRYDVVIDTQGLVKTGWLTSLVSLAPQGRIVGLGNRTEDSGYEWLSRLWYQEKIRIPLRVHVVTRSRYLVAKALGYAVPEQTPEHTVPFPMDFGLRAPAGVVVPEQPQQPYVVLIHATSRADKCWPEADWVALGQRLQAQGYALVLTWGSAAERAVSERLVAQLNDGIAADTPHAFVPPKMNLVQVTGLLDGAQAVVGVDTGLVHIAAALEKPTIELYNFTTAWRTGGFWSPKILNLGQAGALPTLPQVLAGLQTLGILPH